MAIRFTEEEKVNCVRDYIESGLSQKAYHLKNLDVSLRTFERWCSKYRGQCDLMEGEVVTGESTLYDDEGNVKIKWVKTSKKVNETKDLLRSFAEGLRESVPQAKTTPPPAGPLDEDLMAFYVLTDAHIGMRSDEWDLEIAEKVVTGWIDRASRKAGDAHTAVLCVQGDTSHWDSLTPITPASGHVLDADCSTRVMQRMIIKLTTYCIERLLSAHEHVHVMYIIGNHDEHTATLNSEWLDFHYQNEPRVHIDTTDTLYHCFVWGDNVIFSHHGHKRNMSNVADVFVRMYREEYGAAKKAYGHIGHLHHGLKLPQTLLTMELHSTLAGKDDYAKSGGWISDRLAHTIIYHKKYGEFERHTTVPEMLL